MQNHHLRYHCVFFLLLIWGTILLAQTSDTPSIIPSITSYQLEAHPTQPLFPGLNPQEFTLQHNTRSFVAATEICNNGLDDDNDGLVDFYDPDCASNNSYYGHIAPNCNANLSQSSNFAIAQQYETSTIQGIAVASTPIAGDLDGDGSVELIAMADDNLTSASGKATQNLRVFDGSTGALERTILTPFMGWDNASPLGMADVDADGKGEIVIISSGNSINPASDRRFLYCYEDDGTLKWKSNVQVGYSDADYGSTVNFADFNQDGFTEVYVYNQIFNAQTGVLLVQGGNLTNTGTSITNSTGNPANSFAADILPNASGLELVAGNQVYEVNLTNGSGISANNMFVSTTPINLNLDGFSAVADMDNDGQLDIVNLFVLNGNQVRMQVWDGQTSNQLASTILVNGNSAQGIVGMPTIGDLDGDCKPEILVVTSFRITAYELDGNSLVQKWDVTTTDGSGSTGQTLFDFNQDGQVEIVYRDQTNIRIINGANGANLATFPCASSTGWENPLVVDVDNDSQAEIITSCESIGGASGVLRVYGAASTPWAPARSVWNQKSYQPVAVNDDLSIPRTQQDHSFVIANSPCACNGDLQPLNNFMVQATLLSSQGCPLMPAADLTMQMDSLVCTNNASIDVFFQVSNVGAANFPTAGFVAFYAGDPTQTNAPLLGIVNLSSGVNTGQTVAFSGNIPQGNLTPPFTIFGVVNDNGSASRPYNPLTDFPVTGIMECDYTNNSASLPFMGCCPATFGITAIITNEDCPGTGGGAIDISVAGGEAPHRYEWNDLVQTDDRSGLLPGSYTVTVTDANGCIDQATFTVAPGVDNTAPVVICPADEFVQCSADIPAFSVNDVQATDACGITSLLPNGFQDNIASGCAGDPRVIDRMFTAIDANGNVGSCVQTITVEASPLVTITSSNDFVFPAFADSACADVSVVAMGGCLPYTYLWNNGVQTATQSVCPTSSSVYTVTVTDANGCTQTDSVRVCIVEVGCVDNPTPGAAKVLICNVPPGNPQNAQTQCMTVAAAQTHFASNANSYLGACGTLPFRACSFQTCTNSVTIDFEQDGYGNALMAGETITSAYNMLGVNFTIANNRPQHPDKGIIFDTSNPTGGDTDLGTPNAAFGGPGIGAGGGSGLVGSNAVALGNVLIIAENDMDANSDGLVDVPDDEAHGGSITIDFTAPTEVFEIELLDLDDGNGGNILFAELVNGSIASFPIPNLGDNSTYKFPLSLSGVSSIRIEFAGSGALASLTYCDVSAPSKTNIAQNDTPVSEAAIALQSEGVGLTAYPNPFQDQVTLAIQLEEAAATEVVISDLTGKVISILQPGVLPSGTHQLAWEGRSDDGQALSNGIYFARVRTQTHVETVKLVFQR